MALAVHTFDFLEGSKAYTMCRCMHFVASLICDNVVMRMKLFGLVCAKRRAKRRAKGSL